MVQENHYALPELAQRYDADTQDRADLPFYLGLVRELTPAAVADGSRLPTGSSGSTARLWTCLPQPSASSS